MRLELIRSLLLLPLRVVVSAVSFGSYWMEVAADFLVGASSASQYVRRGACRQCGECCRLLALEMPSALIMRPWLVKLMGIWHDAALNFEPMGVQGNLLIYRCRYYRTRKGREGCVIYPFRHRLCRFFPKQMLFGRVELSDDCGFSFVRRDVARRIDVRKRAGDAVFGDVLRGEGLETRDERLEIRE